jgi:hypothetical protein
MRRGIIYQDNLWKYHLYIINILLRSTVQTEPVKYSQQSSNEFSKYQRCIHSFNQKEDFIILLRSPFQLKNTRKKIEIVFCQILRTKTIHLSYIIEYYTIHPIARRSNYTHPAHFKPPPPPPFPLSNHNHGETFWHVRGWLARAQNVVVEGERLVEQSVAELFEGNGECLVVRTALAQDFVNLYSESMKACKNRMNKQASKQTIKHTNKHTNNK